MSAAWSMIVSSLNGLCGQCFYFTYMTFLRGQVDSFICKIEPRL